ncbi:MAG: 50S ribosomal protein L23 [Ignavibacteriales bacterium]|jgi:large subunit ribosomal protein L23|nr:50S ribosomal protein L23 [Ignavibacteriales bacterium]MBP7542042.1 50S ribosomal protein L23 [Ignavibacteriaceae bacterium]MBK7265599.1 50S ribosomal protein L23 [Ignavibacteriales bacterium]MBK7866666.1 50S ribosomal protein L23 [Ignavibacteriales bacterium]MBK8661483.1 50S ribosomal protein L23 [Ignavibacteriales bacterium]
MKEVLIKPLYTEKSVKMIGEHKYGFEVSWTANKIEIAQAIEKKFGVNVVSVNTVKYSGKIKSSFRKTGRFTGKTPRFKKAYVSLKQGEKIELFEQA